MSYSQLKDKAKKNGQKSFFELDTVKEEGDWEYYAVVTNFDLTQWNLQEVFEHHRKRGNAENFVKEGKLPVFTGVDPLDFDELTPLFSRELTPSISLS